MNIELFQKIKELQNEINKTNSILEKKEILKKYTELKDILKYTYDKNIVYNITSKNYKKFLKNDKKTKLKIINSYSNFYKLLNDLSKRIITGNKSLLYLHDFIIKHSKYEDIILNIIDKNLKIRLNINLINSIFPELIPTFSVALANNFNKKFIEKSDNNWYISRKLDGVRCIIHIDKINKDIKCYSRQGKEFETLNKIKIDIINNLHLFKENCYLDGEIVDMKNDKENFKRIMEKIRKKNYTIQNPLYYCFDIIKEEDFNLKKSKEIFEYRYNKLKDILYNNFKFIKLLQQINYNDENFYKYIELSKNNDWEGLILRKNSIYEGKRNNNLLKFKEMLDDEFKVIDLEFGNFRYINQDTGLEEEIETLSAVIIDYNNTKVGSGFTMNERIKYYNNKHEILGKIITVNFFEKTKESLRFPVFKGIHGIERNT